MKWIPNQPVRMCAEFPDSLADSAREKWDAFIRACEEKAIDPAELGDVAKEAKKVFALSEFVARRAVLSPELFLDLAASRDLMKPYAPGEYARKLASACRGAEQMEMLYSTLRKVRARELVRIAFRDLAGWSALNETMTALSDFADAVLEAALAVLHRWACHEYGVPVGESGRHQSLVVIGVGKLGGQELNFSSDIDIIFAFPESGRTKGAVSSITNADFFARLCRRLIELLSKSTIDGFVFRLDTRLRPFGDSGPLAMSFDAMETYYQEQGREWERYALIKGRVVAGNPDAGAELMERLKPFVYRRYLDYGSFDSLRDMKHKISREVSRKGMEGNVKLGPGGIREIEFFGQMFQLIRGGVNPDYQQRQILNILDVLAQDHVILPRVRDELSSAYVFLRNVEHRLQMAEDLQTHQLPESVANRQRLALSMGFAGWESFFQELTGIMDRVHAHFDELLATDEEPGQMQNSSRFIQAAWENLSDPAANADLIRKAGFGDPVAILKIMERFRDLAAAKDVSTQGCQRIQRLVPKIIAESVNADEPEKVLNQIFQLLEAIRRRSCYVALLLENPDTMAYLVKLAGASDLVMSFLSRHPLLLDELLDPRTLYAPLSKKELASELDSRLGRIDAGDLELQMDDLRIFRQINTFRIAAADVAGTLPLMKVSDGLTFLAETVLEKVLEMAWDHLVRRHGLPSGSRETGETGFAIIAYGKLGGLELGYGSDLDLVFLHTGDKGFTAGGRMQPLDNDQFYVRLGQRIIHFLSTQTRTGKLYETDMRLRPSGSSGILVSHVDAFESYQQSAAWTWEHQALIKARPVCGDAAVGKRFLEIRDRMLSLKRDQTHLRNEVVGMREKMRNEQDRRAEKTFNLKQSPGGVIDIEFLVQYLILLHAHRDAGLVGWTDVVRQLNSLALAGIIDDRTAHILKQAYLIFRYYTHRLRLQEKPAVLPDNRFTELRQEVVRIWRAHLSTPS